VGDAGIGSGRQTAVLGQYVVSKRPVTGEAAQGGLGCAVDAEGRHRDDAGRRAGKDDRGAVNEQWKRLLQGEQHTLHVPAERIVVLLFGDASERQVRFAAGIGEQDVNTTRLPIYELVKSVKIAEV
jgi:hypothetical protein